jgi:hypothetical protein
MTSKDDYHTYVHITHIQNLTGRSIRGKVVQSLGTLASNGATGGSVGVQHITINTSTAAGSGALAQAAVVRWELKASGADISGSLVRGVPIASNWRLLGQRQVGLGLLDFLWFV